MLLAAWETKRIIVFCSPLALLVLAVVCLLLLRNTIMTRFRMARQLRKDPDINEWMVVFNWTRKILYVPTILASLIAFVLMLFIHTEQHARIVVGIWLAIFFVNFLVDEYEIGVKVLMIALLFVALLFLWLTFMDWVMPFLRAFTHLGIGMNATGYLVLAIIFALAVAISWIRGLFYYVAITPNYLNIQSGPTENSEQISREDFNTRIDTGDFLERLLGFGRIIITFTEPRRQPVVLLVGRIGRRARLLESIRANLAVDMHGSSAQMDDPIEKKP